VKGLLSLSGLDNAEEISKRINERIGGGINICNYAMQIEGLLEKPA
jgi:hypothetical protein